jgi:hypothetical protein
MVRRFTNSDSNRKILCGNDTDVSDCIITKFHDDLFLCIEISIDEEGDKIYPIPCVWNKKQFKQHFDLQYGSPMQYISQEDFDWMINKY